MLSPAKSNETSKRKNRNRSKGKEIKPAVETKKEEETVLEVQKSSPKSKTDLSDTKKSGEVPEDTSQAGLELIEAVITKFKGKDDHFIGVLEKVLDLFEKTDSKNGKTKLELLDLLISNLLKSSKEELQELKKRIESVLLSTKLVKYFVDSSNVKIEEELESSGIYRLHKGKLIKPGDKRVVFVKRPNLSRQPLYEEALLLSQLDHPNLIKLLAVDNTMMNLILEYMHDDLSRAIVMHKINLSSKNLMKLLIDVAAGMEYLHSKKILHRNLMCDTIYVNSNNECKIGDFTHAVYVGDSCNGEYTDTMHNQVYSMAPEIEHTNKFNFKSDVWAMGIVCWEMFNLISNPGFATVPYLMRCLLMYDFHQRRSQLQFSPVCPQQLYHYTRQIILHRDPSKRPTFSGLKSVLERIKI